MKTISKRAENKARAARLAAISEGLALEAAAVNAAIRAGAVVTVPVRDGSLMSGKTVEAVRFGYDGLTVTMRAYGGSFMLANDGRWAEIVTLAGVERDPRAEGKV